MDEKARQITRVYALINDNFHWSKSSNKSFVSIFSGLNLLAQAIWVKHNGVNIITSRLLRYPKIYENQIMDFDQSFEQRLNIKAV